MIVRQTIVRQKKGRPKLAALMIGESTAVLFVFALLGAVLWMLRRQGLATLTFAVNKKLARERLVQVLERVPLTAHHSLHLVRVQDRTILIGVSPSGCSRIESFSDSGLVEESGRAQ